MRGLAVVLALAILLQCGGCLAVAVVSTASAVTITAVKTSDKVASATVSTTSRVVSAATTTSGDVAAVTPESAAKLTRAGKVVLVDAGTGAIVQLPWREGLQLYPATQTGPLKGAFSAARIFRAGRIISGSLKKIRAGGPDFALHSGDVVELRP